MEVEIGCGTQGPTDADPCENFVHDAASPWSNLSRVLDVAQC